MRPGTHEPPRTSRERTIRRRRVAALGLATMALGALGGGLIYGATRQSEAQRVAERFTRAWERGDYAAMYSLHTPASQRRIRPAGFISAYADARGIATGVRLAAGKARDAGGGLV